MAKAWVGIVGNHNSSKIHSKQRGAMTDFFQDHPLLIVIILIVNSLWLSLLCYCGLRYWIGKRSVKLIMNLILTLENDTL